MYTKKLEVTQISDNTHLDKQQENTYYKLPGVQLNSNIYMDNLNYKYYKNAITSNTM